MYIPQILSHADTLEAVLFFLLLIKKKRKFNIVIVLVLKVLLRHPVHSWTDQLSSV